MFESIINTVANDATITMLDTVILIAMSCLVGLIISITYMKTSPANTYSQNFALTLIILPIVVAIIILLIGSNIARAFSLAGAFSIIRFRSAPGDPKDIAYVLFSMSAGLASGVGLYMYSLSFTVFLCFIMFILFKTGFGTKKTMQKQLKIIIPEDSNYENAFDDIFKNHTKTCALKVIRTKDLGSVYELLYEITPIDNFKEKEFIDELRCRNGNLNITLSVLSDINQY